MANRTPSYRFETERLLLRPFVPRDATDVQRLAGEEAVARTTLSLPHPYPDGAAQMWIDFRTDAARHGHGYTFAIVHKEFHTLMGCISLNMTSEHKRGEIGYWLGQSFWGNGYTTEALIQILQFGFKTIKLNRIWGAAMTKNPASSAVMLKAGLKHEGLFKQHIRKWDQFEDIHYYGLTSEDYFGDKQQKG
ncbi:GNAT family N-acetyltransferase [Paenibacillus sp. OV219]|uniref:GNAT family N-acetyltransferase n=1 Tax=Paenibacillus sp. OV219 TaxID=1884377 RepID=UPI0008D69041|nr:GNAT family N-acetyltransferase [Paenibacillus sp. OV219]SEO24981.1 Protein N-acetyltransferase, RimJ/RimL family [Paenibacillus sp. OV219]